MHFDLAFPRLKTLALAAVTFIVQILLFLGGDYLLYQIPFRTQGMMTVTESFLWMRYYPALELGLFAASTVIVWAVLTFAVKTLPRRRVTMCLCAELLVFAIIGLVSSLDNMCSNLISGPLNEFTGLPTCGFSSLNIKNGWFLTAALLTVLLWSVIVSGTGRFAFTLSLKRKQS